MNVLVSPPPKMLLFGITEYDPTCTGQESTDSFQHKRIGSSHAVYRGGFRTSTHRATI